MTDYLLTQNVELPLDDVVVPAPDGPLAAPIEIDERLTAPNRFAILPMEGWDGTIDGKPSAAVERRWHRLATSGAGLLWGEATAVVPEGRANPNQLVMNATTVESIAALREQVMAAHGERFDDALIFGLQLTHSGRWSRPLGEPAPRLAYRQTLLDQRVPVTDAAVFSDDELDGLVERFIEAGTQVADAGFDFVDIKHCHGYLLHELLHARERPGRYGGSFENRTRFLRSVVAGLKERRSDLTIAVRLSATDPGPYRADGEGVGYPEADPPFGFGPDEHGDPRGEANRFLDLCTELGIPLVSISVGGAYYNPHVMRPAYHPALDGYLPPREPLAEVAYHLDTAAEFASAHPDLTLVGSGYTYLQEMLPNAAQYRVRTGQIDMVGVGRMALSYPDLPAEVLAGNDLDPTIICRTFSDCTTGPRIGLASGCYPLDEHYKKSEARVAIAAAKKEKKAQTA
jgi:2,4-dienoyl-CoA reductase-like NADH-dependent reductase (Old Yellow Enzyme family)